MSSARLVPQFLVSNHTVRCLVQGPDGFFGTRAAPRSGRIVG
jgi:hypothetical protein